MSGATAIDANLAAVVLRRQDPVVCSYDRGFDPVPGVRRREP